MVHAKLSIMGVGHVDAVICKGTKVNFKYREQNITKFINIKTHIAPKWKNYAENTKAN